MTGTAAPGAEARGLLGLAALAVLVGVAAGIVGVLFRLALEQAEAVRGMALALAKPSPVLGPVLFVLGCAAATAVAAALVRRLVPEAAGSGIPHVEAVLDRELPPATPWLIPIKFVGGVLAIGAGLALGREGPSVQMGASLAHVIAGVFRRGWEDCRALMAGGAGAGLATAFNAPVAGAIFVLEELIGRFEPRIAVVALGASAGAIAVAHALVPDVPVFDVPALAGGGLAEKPLFLVLGLLAGGLAIVYNRVHLAALVAAERIGGPVELRAAGVGAAVGLVAWVAPGLVGGGDPLTEQALQGVGVLAILPAIFLFRMLLGAVSYAAATPGGLFAPMLVLGAQAGLAFGLVSELVFPGMAVEPAAFAVVGMAALFTGVVRAPLTGIALVTEMTGSTTLLLPLLAGTFGAMLVPALVGDPPIYTSLRHRAAKAER